VTKIALGGGGDRLLSHPRGGTYGDKGALALMLASEALLLCLKKNPEKDCPSELDFSADDHVPSSNIFLETGLMLVCFL